VYLPDDGFLKAETCSKVLLENTDIINFCVVTAFNKYIIHNTTHSLVGGAIQFFIQLGTDTRQKETWYY
jgi:hypothetical protein